MNEEPSMPSVTPGPIIGLLAAALSVAAAFGLHINTDQSVALIGLGGALGVAIPAIEAWLRRGRLNLLVAREQAKTPAPAAPAALPQSSTVIVTPTTQGD